MGSLPSFPFLLVSSVDPTGLPASHSSQSLCSPTVGVFIAGYGRLPTYAVIYNRWEGYLTNHPALETRCC